jgi:hypothetical protein
MMVSKHLLILIISAKIRHQNKKINEILCTLDTGFENPINPRLHYSSSMHTFFRNALCKLTVC